MNLSRNSTFLFDLFNLREEAELSYYFDLSVIQDSFRYRALHRARAISQQLVTDKGEIDKEFLHRIVMELKNNGYAFYPDGFPSSAQIAQALSKAALPQMGCPPRHGHVGKVSRT